MMLIPNLMIPLDSLEKKRTSFACQNRKSVVLSLDNTSGHYSEEVALLHEVVVKLRAPREHTRDNHSTIVFRGPLIGPPLCRETPVSRTADVSFFPFGRET